MSKRQFFVIAFRVIAIYLFLSLIGNLSSYLVTVRRTAYLDSTTTIFAIGVVGLSIVGFLFVVWLLWKKSEWLMERILAVPILQDTQGDGSHTEDEEGAFYDPYDSPLT